MKISALTLCLAGTLVTCAAAVAQDTKADPAAPSQSSSPYISTDRPVDGMVLRELYRNPDHTLRDPYTGVSIHAGARLFHRDVLFPELQDERIVAASVTEIVTKQQKEAAMLNAIAPRARTAGFENVETVYEHMAGHHTTLAEFGSQWLSERGYTVPTPPTEVQVSDDPAATVDEQISLHEQALADAIAKRREEKSSTVRGMLLWAATTTTHHLSVLRTLDRDIDVGRKTTSAMLRLQLAPPGVATASTTELIEQYITEERELFPAPPPVTVQTVVEERIVERIVEKPVVEERIVEKIVEKPVIVEKIVEKPIYVERPAPTTNTSRVAGQRQTTRSRARRPAK